MAPPWSAAPDISPATLSSGMNSPRAPLSPSARNWEIGARSAIAAVSGELHIAGHGGPPPPLPPPAAAPFFLYLSFSSCDPSRASLIRWPETPDTLSQGNFAKETSNFLLFMPVVRG